MSRTRWVAVGAMVVVATVLTALVTFRLATRVADERAARLAPTPVPSAVVGGTGPGALLGAVTVPGLDRSLTAVKLRAAKIEYRSTEGDTGTPTVVSGTVFVPAGDPPAGGWPVVAFGHGTTGIQTPCAPSLSANLLNQAPLVAGFVKQGYALAFPDYQGLGAAGDHPYLDAKTAGLNVIDAVRALRATFPNVSTRWAAFGGSQGGGAVWAAAEQAEVYAPELHLVGAVALSPAADMTGLVDKSARGAMTVDQRPLMQWILVSLHRLHPDLDLDDFRRGVAARYWDALSACSGPLVHTRSEVAPDIGARDMAPSGPAEAARLRELLARWALPQRKLSAPLSVVYGTEDTYIDPQWTTDALARACSLGGTIRSRLEPGKGHADIDGGDQLGWLADRFASKDIADGCTH